MNWREVLKRPLWGTDTYTQNPHNTQNSECVRGFGDIGDIGYTDAGPSRLPIPVQLDLNLRPEPALKPQAGVRLYRVQIDHGQGEPPRWCFMIGPAMSGTKALRIARQTFSPYRVVKILNGG